MQDGFIQLMEFNQIIYSSYVCPRGTLLMKYIPLFILPDSRVIFCGWKDVATGLKPALRSGGPVHG